MGYDFMRTTSTNKKEAFLEIMLIFCYTGVCTLLYGSVFNFSMSALFETDILQFQFASSFLDVMILNYLRFLCVSFYWFFATMKIAAFLCTTFSILYYCLKWILLFTQPFWNVQLHAILIISLLTASAEIYVLVTGYYENTDPDVEFFTTLHSPFSDEAAAEQELFERNLLPEHMHGANEKLEDVKSTRNSYFFFHTDATLKESLSDWKTSTTSVEKRKTFFFIMKKLFFFSKPDYTLLSGGIFFLILSSFFKLLIPNFAAVILTAIIDPRTKSTLLWESLFFLCVVIILTVIFTSLRIWCTAKMEVRLNARLQRILLAKLAEKDISYFDEKGTGHLMSRLTSDTTLLSSTITTNLNHVIQNVVNLVGTVIILFVVGWQLALIYTTLSIFFFVLTQKFGEFAKRYQVKVQDIKSEANHVADQILSLIRIVRVHGTEAWERDRYNYWNRQQILKELIIKMAFTIYVPIVLLIQNSLLIIVLIFGRRFLLLGYFSTANLSVFVFYAQNMGDTMTNISQQILQLMTGLGAGERIIEIIEETPKIPIEGGIIPEEFPPSKPMILLKNVCFAYPSAPHKLVLKNINISLKRGEKVGIVGLSGCGKSTLFSLLCRFYDPTFGKILINGVEYSKVSAQWLRSKFGVVMQEPPLFSVSIKENIAYGNPDFSEEEIIEVAKLAQCHDFIHRLPLRYETSVGERGSKLSGGQRQRIALARALIRRPSFLFLDEATSALDSQSEVDVYTGLNYIHKQLGIGMLIIAHRLSTIKDADRLLVLHKGELCEEGSHEELMKAGGMYASLVQQQMIDDSDSSESTHSTKNRNFDK